MAVAVEEDSGNGDEDGSWKLLLLPLLHVGLETRAARSRLVSVIPVPRSCSSDMAQRPGRRAQERQWQELRAKVSGTAPSEPTGRLPSGARVPGDHFDVGSLLRP